MFRAFSSRRWPTSALAAVGLVVGVLAYWSGRNAERSRSAPAVAAAAPAARAWQPEVRTAPTTAGVNAAVNSPPPPVRVADTSDDHRWQNWLAVPRTPETEQEMVAFLVALAARDPGRAMGFALGEANLRLRELLRNAVLRGWASTAPDEAAAEAVKVPAEERPAAMEALFAGAARVPERAAQLGARLCAEHPTLASDYGQFLISALNEAGAYEAAAHFASSASTPENRNAWLTAVFYEWAAHQPEQALAAFGNPGELAGSNPAFQGLVSGWARADPAGLAGYAVKLPAGEVRAAALTQALPQWVMRDASGAAAWISRFDPSADLDAGVAAVALLPDLVEQRPNVALGWAKNISDAVLRANTLHLVAQQWVKKDADGVRHFLADTPALPAEERTALTDGLNPPPDS